MRYLSVEELLVIHSEIIDATGGLHGVREIGLLRSISEKPKTKIFGHECYQGIFQKAAVCLESVANYHVFIDGNKRTALAAGARFLAVNGYELTVTNQEAEKFMLCVATEHLDLETIAAWLKRYSRRQKK